MVEEIVHASAVVFDRKGVLICGKSGSGKSSLALQLMAFGAHLVADDRTVLRREGTEISLTPAPNIEGMIEARGVGILTARANYPVPLCLTIEMDAPEKDRLPPVRHRTWLDLPVPCLRYVSNAAFPAMIMQYLQGGRAEV